MNKIQFLSLLTKLIKEVEKKPSDERFDQIVEYFEEYLKIYPHDTETWLKFALLFLWLPKDEDNALGCLQKILEYDPENVIAKLLFSCFSDYFGGVDKPVFELLCTIETTNRELLSIAEFEKSKYYSYSNKELHKKTLLKSIDYCDTFVWNYKHLGLQYLYEEKDIENAHFCFQKALNNIQYVYTLKEDYDPLNIEEFINERLKGVHVTDINFESIQRLVEICT